VRNIEATNAVEALACWLALNYNGWHRDARLRGATKMRGATDLSFANMRKPSFYVTQPMRQATVQPLRALGLVESTGERFNAFSSTQVGRDIIDAVCSGHYPCNRTVLEHLGGWASGAHHKVHNSAPLTEPLSPLEPMPQSAREVLRERIVRGTGTDAIRRRTALDWVDRLRDQLDRQVEWGAKPPMLDDGHWKDLHAGALFFTTRDAAIELLHEVEGHISNQSVQKLFLDQPFPGTIVAKIRSLQHHGQAFLDNGYDPSPGVEASAFCRECTEQGDARLLEHLLAREGRVLRQYGRDIVPGVAFREGHVAHPEAARSAEEEGAEADVGQGIPLPDGISHRVSNLFLLNLDLHGNLDDWLGTPDDDER
jgi:hypothetical protein